MKQTVEKYSYCGASHFAYLYCTSTALYCTPVYENGKWTQKDPNKYCYNFQCLECGKTFSLDHFPTQSNNVIRDA